MVGAGGLLVDEDEWVAVAPAVYVWVKVTDELAVYVGFGGGCVHFAGILHDDYKCLAVDVYRKYVIVGLAAIVHPVVWKLWCKMNEQGPG